jgi:hypothetical protein
MPNQTFLRIIPITIVAAAYLFLSALPATAITGKYHTRGLPRLASVSVATQINNNNAVALAQYDIILAQKCTNTSNSAALIHEHNPQAKVLYYQDVAESSNTVGCSLDLPFHNAIVNFDYFLKNTSGGKIDNSCTNECHYLTDLNPANTVNGMAITQWAADTIYNPWLSPGGAGSEFDGIFWDVEFWDQTQQPGTEWWRMWSTTNQCKLGGCTPISLPSTVNHNYRTGLGILHQRTRDGHPDKIFVTNGNSVIHNSTDGILIEHFDNWNWTSNMMAYFMAYDGPAGYGVIEPNVNILHNRNSTDYRSVRRLIASTLMHDGYVAVSTNGYNQPGVWYDEYSVGINGSATGNALGKGYMGLPLGEAYEANNPSNMLRVSLRNEVLAYSGVSESKLWRRDFENAIALINPSTIAQTANLGTIEFRRINGTQDSSVNNGALVTSFVNVPPEDGLILLKVVSTPITPTLTPTPTITPTPDPVCDLCGYCDSNSEYPIDYEQCIQCMYGLPVPGPPPTHPTPGHLWTIVGCIESTSVGVVQSISSLLIPVAGGGALLVVLIGSMIILISRGEYAKIKIGRRLITTGIGALIIIIFSVFIFEFIGVDILKIPGLGG